jgi:hypothetical protein
VFTSYFGALAEGDPIALAATAVFVLFLLVIGIVVLRYRAEERREQQRKRERWYGKKSPGK